MITEDRRAWLLEALEPYSGDVHSAYSGMLTQNSDEWSPEFASWAPRACVLNDRCVSGIGPLHLSFSEWCLVNKSVPCSREVFERLLTCEGFHICEGLVASLILKEDLEALTLDTLTNARNELKGTGNNDE